MKLCKRRTHTPKTTTGSATTYDYVLEDDVYAVHGKEFTEKWKEYISKKPMLVADGEQRYYYYDYKECVLKTNCWFVQ
jgi:hypothetical protein